jgi:Protein of unknown function (DUF2637)
VTGNTAIRAATAQVVTTVASFAAVVSFGHIRDLAAAHGQDALAATLTPLSVDGLILAASLVLLHEARNWRSAPGLARFALWLGVGGTIAANAAYGWPYGPVGIVASTWPGGAFVLTVELVMLLVRRARPQPGASQLVTTVAAGAAEAAKVALQASIAAGNALSQRALASRFGMTRPAAAKLAKEVATSANGHG